MGRKFLLSIASVLVLSAVHPLGVSALMDVLFTDDFEDGSSADWQEFSSGWSESGGEYHATNTSANRPVASVYRNGYTWGDYVVEADVQPLSNRTTAAAGLRFRFQDEHPSSRSCSCDLFRLNTGQPFLQLACYGVVNTTQPFPWTAFETYRLRATAIGDTVSCEVVGSPESKITASDPAIELQGTAGLRATHIPADFDNFVVRPVDATPSTGTTVLVHGFQAGGGSVEVPPWVRQLAESIRARAGAEATVHDYQPATGRFESPLPDEAGGERILILDWADDSNNEQRGFSEAAADAFFAALMSHEDRLDLDNLHLIGHSRGAVVVSEMAERLIRLAGITVRQVTTLDPHDDGAQFRTLTDYDVNDAHADEYGARAGFWRWDNVDYWDNYYQDDGIDLLKGEAIPQSVNLRIDASLSHSDVHEWYRATVPDGAPPADINVGAGWFSNDAECSFVTDGGVEHLRAGPLQRELEGFYYSRLGGGIAACQPAQVAPQQPRFDFCREGIVNGDLDHVMNGGIVPGWDIHGGYVSKKNVAFNRLVMKKAGDLVVHNRFYIPSDATTLHYRRQGKRKKFSELHVWLEAPNLDAEDSEAAEARGGIDFVLASEDGGWIESSLEIPGHLRGRVGVLKAKLHSGAKVLIDDFRLDGLCPSTPN